MRDGAWPCVASNPLTLNRSVCLSAACMLAHAFVCWSCLPAVLKPSMVSLAASLQHLLAFSEPLGHFWTHCERIYGAFAGMPPVKPQPCAMAWQILIKQSKPGPSGILY